MARSRNIKPGFFTNEDLVELSFETRLLFIGLWTVADKSGRLEDRPKKIRMSVFPADDVDVEACLSDLANYEFITRYTVDGQAYIQVNNWDKHQNPHHREKDSTIPEPGKREDAPLKKDTKASGNNLMQEAKASGFTPMHEDKSLDKNETDPRQAQDKPSTSPSDSLIPDSLIPDSLIPSKNTLIKSKLSIDDKFQTFWEVYPRKAGKGAAEKKFKQLKPDDDLYNQILSAIASAKRSEQWIRDGGQFIPHPATWLNQKRWEDEPIPHTPDYYPGGQSHAPCQPSVNDQLAEATSGSRRNNW